MLALWRHLRAPIDGIYCSEMRVSDLAKFLVIIFCHTPNDPSLILAATHKIGARRIKVKAPYSRSVPSDRVLAHPLVH